MRIPTLRDSEQEPWGTTLQLNGLKVATTVLVHLIHCPEIYPSPHDILAEPGILNQPEISIFKTGDTGATGHISPHLDTFKGAGKVYTEYQQLL